jgi:hypothetical protein
LLNPCESLHSTFPKIDTKFDAHLLFLSLIHRENHHKSCTQLQTNARENCPRPWHGSPTIYRCFMLPQLLYRWRHQSGIFWIPPCIIYSTSYNTVHK